jgi:FHS family Na+ dependent glucose MFS transporter 1
LIESRARAAADSRWPASVRLYLASFLVVGLALSVLGPALTELRDRSGSGIGGIGVLFAGQSVGYVVGSLAAGRLYDRFDGHRVYAVALVVLGCGLGLLPMSDDITGMFVAFVIIGVGASTADLGANTLLLWQLGPGSGRAMNLLHLCFGFGALLAPLVVHVGLGVAGWVAGSGCVMLAGWALTIPAPLPPRTARAEHTTTTAPLLALLAAFFFVYVGLEIGFAGWITTYGQAIDFSKLTATWLTTAFWFSFTIGRMLASAFGDRTDPERVLTVASVASLVAALVLIAGDGRHGAVWSGTVLMGLATAPQFPGMLMLAERRIRLTGSATAWFVCGAGCGGLVYPWAIGQFFEQSGETALPWAALVLGVATFGVFVTAARSLNRTR